MPRPRSVTSSLRRFLDSLSRVVAVIDADGALVYVNGACADWTGFATKDIIGEVCQYHGSPEPTSPAGVAAALCPPPEVAEGNIATTRVTLSGADGSPNERRLVFLPLSDDDGGYDGAIVIEQTPEVADALAAACWTPSSAGDLHDELRTMRDTLSRPYRLDRLVGTSVATGRLRDQLAVAAATDCNVLVIGPTGSRREDVARTVHYAGCRDEHERLIPLSCGLIDAELLESTLESFARADVASGVLLLGDVDQLGSDAQTSLVRLLRRQRHIRRVLATAREDLDELARRGEFRHDLAGMIGTLTVALEPLGHRAEDVPYLAQLYLEDENARGKRQLSGFSPEALDFLSAYDWPGDVAELATLVARLHAEAETTTVRSRDLPLHIRAPAPQRSGADNQDSIVLDEYLAGIELELIQRALGRAKGNKALAARLLGMTRPRLYRRLEQLGVETDDATADNASDEHDDDENC